MLSLGSLFRVSYRLWCKEAGLAVAVLQNHYSVNFQTGAAAIDAVEDGSTSDVQSLGA